MPKIIIALVGMPCSGKGTISSYLRTQHDAEIVPVSGIFHTIARLLPIPATRKNMVRIARFLMWIRGEGWVVRRVATRVWTSEKSIVIIEGIRMLGTLQEYTELFPDGMVIGIHADVKTRWKRARLRGEKPGESRMPLQEFMREDLLKTEREIPLLLKKADHLIPNDQSVSLGELYASVDRMIAALHTRLSRS